MCIVIVMIIMIIPISVIWFIIFNYICQHIAHDSLLNHLVILIVNE